MNIEHGSRGEADVRAAVRAAWTTTLPVPVRDDEADFFASGGDSLTAQAICSVLEERFGTRPALRLLFDHPRLGDHARVVWEQLGRG